MKGLVHIYTGSGKGKTSAAIGLGIRACGKGLRVLMIQFLKGAATGEIATLKRLEPDFVLKRVKGNKKFTWDMSEEELGKLKTAEKGMFDYAVYAASSNGWDVIILDEIMAVITYGLIEVQDVVNFVKNKPDGVEIVLTGRNAPIDLVELAHYVSEIRSVKHPMEKGIPARKGIEY